MEVPVDDGQHGDYLGFDIAQRRTERVLWLDGLSKLTVIDAGQKSGRRDGDGRRERMDGGMD